MKKAFLTIDDGPTDDFNRKVDFLKGMGIPAIFFCEGMHLEERPDDVIRAIRQGYVIGNHSYSHPAFSEIALEEGLQQIERTEVILADLYQSAKAPRPGKLFRFPGGNKGGDPDKGYWETIRPETEAGKHRKRALQDFLRSMGYRQPKFGRITYKWYESYGLADDADCYWTYTAYDWGPVEPDLETGIDSPEKVLARMDEDAPEWDAALNSPDSDDIILLHDMPGIEDLFIPMIEKLLTKDLMFEMPPLDAPPKR